MITIYGIKNCDKCRAAQKWFTAQGADFKFHDIRADGLDEKLIRKWQSVATGGTLLNRRSQTWRKIPQDQRKDLTPAAERRLAISYPTVIKRPVVADEGKLHIGYDEVVWKKLF